MILPSFIDKIRYNKSHNNYTLTLKNDIDSSLFSLSINSSDAKKISLAKSGIISNKLNIYDIFINFLTMLNASVDKIKVIRNNKEIYAQIILKINKKKYILDSFVVDALILSLKTLSNVYIHESLFSKDNKIEYIGEEKLSKNNPSIQLDKLSQSLKKLIKNENYESAAVIRNRILEIKKKLK